MSYSPKLNNENSSVTINKSVKIEKLIDKTNLKERNRSFMGTTYTKPDDIPGNDLATLVTREIVSDFSKNYVFEKVSEREQNPDYIIKGEINKFTSAFRASVFTKICFYSGVGILAPFMFPTSLFGLPVMGRNVLEIDITLHVYDKNGNLINSYNGIYESKNWISVYKQVNQHPLKYPAITDAAFSQCVMQIREKITQDIAKLQ